MLPFGELALVFEKQKGTLVLDLAGFLLQVFELIFGLLALCCEGFAVVKPQLLFLLSEALDLLAQTFL